MMEVMIALAALALFLIFAVSHAGDGSGVGLPLLSSLSAPALSQPDSSPVKQGMNKAVDAYADAKAHAKSLGTADRKKMYLQVREERQRLSTVFKAKRKPLVPLEQSINKLRTRIAYIKRYPGDTASQTIPLLQSQLEMAEAEYQKMMGPLNAWYQSEQKRLNKLMSIYR